MIEPQGPLPSEVYWRRRLVAIVGAVVAVAVVIALIVWAGSSSDDADPANAAASGSSSSTAKAPAPEATSSAAPPSSSEAPSGGGDHGNGGDPSAAASETAPAPGNSDAPAAPAIENLCSDQSLSVVLYTDKPTYTQGDQPVFTIVTTNGGLAACNRDIGKNAQNVIVRSLDGARTLWSAQDCAPDKSVNVQLLQPGQQVSDDITWSGATSSPGCKKPRQQIPAGAYQAIAKLGEKESAPITFNVVKPAQQ